MRIMGLDYGSKTVGVAISDVLGMTAQPVETIVRKEENKLRKTCARLEALIQEYHIERIVLGRPLNMDDTAGERVEQCEIFKAMLERRTGLEIVWQDERLTTVEADQILADSGVKKEDRKKYIDQVAASLILKEYMENYL
ncbi:Holliday junction resolvase RuvX [Lachnospiraceae bacterium oral taxon 096]|jgi:RNAse H domain protein, YqgF family|nr:Holliday junction resolvase RuvX [Lachnospiraceae bacterium oral taxon 096]QUI95988.1 Holliday junction resolvase RuvX [Lachnospiraceae bacterium oral taxon 096]